MPEFIVTRLSRTEAEASRQAFQHNIDYFQSTCQGCKQNPTRRGCCAHQGIISSLKDLKRRFRFTDGPVISDIAD